MRNNYKDQHNLNKLILTSQLNNASSQASSDNNADSSNINMSTPMKGNRDFDSPGVTSITPMSARDTWHTTE